MGGFTGVPPGGGAPPAGGGGGDDPLNSALNNLRGAAIDQNKSADAILALAQATTALTDAAQKLPRIGEDVSKKFAKAASEMKGLVMLADTAADAMKEMAGYSKSLTKTIAGEKSLKNVRATLEAIAKSGKAALDGGLLDPRQAATVQKSIEGARKKLEEFADMQDDAFSDAKHAQVVGFLKDTNRELEKMGTLSARVNLGFKRGGLTERVAGVRKKLIDAGVMKAGRFEKYTKYGEAAVTLKEAARAKREGRQRDFIASRDAAQTKVREIFGLSPDTEINVDKLRTRKQRMALAKQAGGNPADTMALLQQAGAGPKMGLMGKLTGGGFVESAAGTMAEMAGKMAIPLAIAEAVKDLIVSVIDKNAEMNKQAETLGAGGVFLGGGTGNDNLMAARNNLSGLQPGGLFSKYGLNYERNVKMAQTMIGAGYNVESLGAGGPLGNKTGDFGPGSFGQVQKIAATTGRVAGMTDEQSINTVMKLLMQYRESMEGTDAFFTNLTKDSRAAGVTATKYVSIIDEILNHFDRMNKTLDQVTGTMRMLSRTGRSTTEDLQAMMESLTGAGRTPMDLASAGFVATQMRQGPGLENMRRTGEQSLSAAAGNVHSAITDIGITNLSEQDVRQKLGSPEGREELRGLIDNAKLGGKFDVNQIIRAQGAVDQGASAARGLQFTKQFMNNQMSAVDYASAMMSKGMGPQEQENFRNQAMETIMQKSGYTIQDMMAGKGVSPKLKMMLEGAIPGFKAEDIETRAQVRRNAASARFGLAAEPEAFQENPAKSKAENDRDRAASDAKNDMRTKAMVEEIANLVPELKPDTKGVNTPQDYLNLMRKWEKDPHAHGKILAALALSQKTSDEIADTQSDVGQGLAKSELAAKKQANEEKAKGIASVTQSTAEIFANVFSTYFNQIIGYVSKLWNFLSHSSILGGGTSAASEQQGKDIVDSLKPEIKNAQAANDLRIKWLENKKAAASAAGQDTGDIQAQIADELKKQNQLADKDKFGVGSGMTKYDATNIASITRDELKAASQPIVDSLSDMGVKMDQNGDATLTPQQYQQQGDMLQAAVDKGLAKATENKDTSGATTSITYHMYSSELKQFAGVADQTSRSVDRQRESQTVGGGAK